MLGRRKRDIADEAADFGTTLVEFLATLGALVRNAATWLGLVSFDAISSGADVLAHQAGSIAGASRAKAKSARKRGRKTIFNLALIGGFLWWLDRDLSDSDADR